MRALQVRLKQEVTRNDAFLIMNWMEDQEVTKYLNETSHISSEIHQTINRVNLYIMTPLFNRNGSFFVVCTGEDQPVGFIKLIRKSNEAEMVIAIGDRAKWGLGIGKRAIRQGLNHAFFDWRISQVIAKISSDNIRSIHAFEKSGFTFERNLNNLRLYRITLEDYIKL